MTSIQNRARLLIKNRKFVRMPFGKHAGKPLTEIPKDYVRWLAKNGALDKKENAPQRGLYKIRTYLEV